MKNPVTLKSLFATGLIFSATFGFAADSHAKEISRALVTALDSGDAFKVHKFVATYCTHRMTTIEHFMLEGSKNGKHTFVKMVFDAPYESIAEVHNKKYGTEHLTCWRTPEGKVYEMILHPDNPSKK